MDLHCHQKQFGIVCDFYESNDISRVMPGKKDFVSVKEGKRHNIQKRLVLSNLRRDFHITKIGFSQFAELRPKHCVLAGANGTHSVCVCTIHQNVKLMSLVQEMQIPELPTYHHCLAKIVCNPPHPRCYLRECDACPEIETLKAELLTYFDEIDVEQIIYKQWVSTNRSTLETFSAQLRTGSFYMQVLGLITFQEKHWRGFAGHQCVVQSMLF